MIKTIGGSYSKTYVGYTININDRVKKHSSNKGAKSTKGFKWKIIFKKKFLSKSAAMSYEYKLKKDYTKRKKILNQSIK